MNVSYKQKVSGFILSGILLACLAQPGRAETLTGEWNGHRQALGDRGVDLSLLYKGEVNSTVAGGKERKSVGLGNLDLKAALDWEKMVGWPGGSALVYFLGNQSGQPSEIAGDLQGTSNIEVPKSSFKLYEIWLQQAWWSDRFSILAGVHDLNSEFYVTEASGLFFNSSFGVGKELSQTGVNGPSVFPNAAPAVRIRVKPMEVVYTQVGVFGAQAGDPAKLSGTNIRWNPKDGYLVIAEAGLEFTQGDVSRKYAVGYWGYTKKVPDLSANEARNQGTYMLVNHGFNERFSTFLRLGLAAAAVNQVSVGLATGIVATGVVPQRPLDRLGLGVARVQIGDKYREVTTAASQQVSGAETAVELSYRVELGRGIAVQPDLQYIVEPGADPNLDNALVLAARLELDF